MDKVFRLRSRKDVIEIDQHYLVGNPAQGDRIGSTTAYEPTSNNADFHKLPPTLALT